MTTKTDTRSHTIELTINATVEDVWKALTDGIELARWFPNKATVTPGVGGTIRMEWTDLFAGEERILAWDPPRHLRTSWPAPPPEGVAAAPQLAVDYFIESKGGKTMLRLVHSGFSTSPEWDKEYDSTRRGWKHELRSLRHYLENHRGRDRSTTWVRARVDGDPKEVFHRFMSSQGILAEGSLAGLGEGDRYAITLTTGDRFEGTVIVNDALDFAGTVANMGNALLRTMVENCTGAQEAHLWLSGWNLPEAELKEMETRFRDVLAKLYPQSA
jgi:uncharacterized protein YndB with AHSA1/START domain